MGGFSISKPNEEGEGKELKKIIDLIQYKDHDLSLLSSFCPNLLPGPSKAAEAESGVQSIIQQGSSSAHKHSINNGISG